ncbi:hypothetical protein ACFSTI_13975 [Rhizorhabdus histidinilytica]
MTGVAEHFDLLIRNGIVVDGTGLPRRRLDVGIRDGRIAKFAHLGKRPPTRRSTPQAASSPPASSIRTPIMIRRSPSTLMPPYPASTA